MIGLSLYSYRFCQCLYLRISITFQDKALKVQPSFRIDIYIIMVIKEVKDRLIKSILKLDSKQQYQLSLLISPLKE